MDQTTPLTGGPVTAAASHPRTAQVLGVPLALTDYEATLDWIDETSMSDVLLRHYPELAPALRGVENAFAPWTRVSA